MKRDHPNSERGEPYLTGASTNKSSGKVWKEEKEEEEEKEDSLTAAGGGMDELLAVLGYKVRSSDMAEVAQKLEQLEMVLGIAQEDGISHLSTDTVHYNPSDLSGWVQSMLSELNTTLPQQPATLELDLDDDLVGDLRAIPGIAAYPEGNENNRSKRMRVSAAASSSIAASSSSSSSSILSSGSELIRPVLLIDSQETGVRLVHTLLACAEAVQQENMKLADALVKHVGLLAASQPGGAMRKVATYFAEALARRIYKLYPQEYSIDPSYSDTLEMHFYETCPYLKFAHFTANQAILEAFASAGRVHVIDFGLKQGMQWPALMQALALRPGGPPSFRLTGIGPPQPDNTDALQLVGWKLAKLAEAIGVEFEFRGFVANSLADIEPKMLDIRPSEVEVVAVNSVFELHGLLARPGGIDKVLASVRAMKPQIVTIVEQEANHNGPVFLDRFTEALHYYSSLFDSLEGCSGSVAQSQDLVMSELYLGRQICNVVACEGVDRVERHESLNQWKGRMESAGFDLVLLGSNAYRQASMLLALFAGGDGYGVEENNGCLMLGWHTRPLIATSAWRLAGQDDQGVNESTQFG